MNTRYIKPAAQMMVWGLVLFVGGAAVSGYLGISGLTGMAAPGSLDPGIYFVGTVILGVIGLLGFILLLAGGWRIAHRIDERYEAWYSKAPQIVPAHEGSEEELSQADRLPMGELQRLPLKQAPQIWPAPPLSRLPERRLIIVIS